MKNNKGFSLVELIVVIAIMAILAAVAVVGFSMYIPKAQQATDKQMFSDLESALTYASLAGTFEEGEGGYIILSTEGVVNDIEKGSSLDIALTDAFGANYRNELKLAYDSWGNNYLFLGLAGESAQNVYNSTYYAVSDELMGQVKDITDAALSILDNGVGSGNSRNDMIGMFAKEGEAAGQSAFLNEIAVQYGYNSLDEVPDEALPNLLVLAVATDVTTSNNNEDYQMSETSGLIQNFALYNGYASTEQGKAEGFDVAYNTFVEEMNAATDINGVADAYKKLQAATKAENSGYNAYVAGQGKTDMEAFDSMLAGLTGSTLGNKEMTKEGLTDADFFTTGVGNSLFGAYIDSVESFVGIQTDDSFAEAMIQEGVVGFYFTFVNSEMVINNSLPIN